MFRSAMVIILLVVACGLDVSAQATRNTGERKTEEVTHRMELQGGIMVSPYVAGGLLMGGVADSIKQYDDGLWRRSVYGFGISGDYGISRRVRVGVRTEFMWAKVANYDVAQVRMWTLATNGMVLAKPQSSQSAYLRGELGIGSITLPNWWQSDAGTHMLARIGLGLQSFIAFSRATRTEVYYRVVFTEGYEDSPLSRSEVPMNITHFGIEIAMAFGL